ncbi:C4-dicarboxylate ABC transporter substrate-binding protein [Sulfitobacter sp. HI0082]|uniref:TAXI family TRAP transporter solute-binding subunit n=1 Tax=uncultured Sulfitobacter sp. TaxID=191468 RepID=UPI0007D0116A|nr:C4-dicarboxylate ABC transporter substrate-binding protein [Sulfitobacter sp. HI0082]HAC48243.1 C4-dicarboxylate ABC transporter substrate-binding protein [Sulfitobacter sp.]|tara:strand:+ start:1556 stop:2587 length:1032 start_codon:yes stop_codon:yes gene_type:complete
MTNPTFSRRSFLGTATGAAALAALPGGAFAKDILRMSTLGPGTSPNLVMTTFASIVNGALPDYEIQLNATGAATRHVLEVAMGRSDFCMSSPAIHALMRRQAAMYEKIEQAPELVNNLRTVLNFPMGVYHIAVYDSSGITSMDQIAGKRVFLGPPGGAAYATMARLFKAVAGLEEGTDYEAVKLGWDAAAAAFQDGNLDVYCNPTNAPSPALTQIAVTNKIRFLGIPADTLETEGVQALVGRPGFSAATLPAGIYGDNQANEGDVTTLGVTVGIVTNKDADEEMIYQMTKAFYEGVKEAGESAPWLRAITPAGAVQDINLLLHPGALRALTELGVEIPDAAKA